MTVPAIALSERPVAASVDDLLAGARQRDAMLTGDSKSGAAFERVVIDGGRFVVKYLHVDDDWIMRSSGDLRCRPLLAWRSGLLDALPDCVDHAIVGAACGLGRNGWGGALLMHDVGGRLVPEGDEPVPLDQHLRFLDHMAALHARFWGWHDAVGLLPAAHRYTEFAEATTDVERARGWPSHVPPLVVEGWSRFPRVAPRAASAVLDLLREPWPLVDALAAGPQTLLHGDWKMGNLGSHPDGRTILLDWAMTGQGAVGSELAWYLSINAARLPHAKEDAIDAYRRSLEDHGIPTAPWWDRHLALALLGALVQFGWEKALGGPGPELGWWEDRAVDGALAL